MGFNSKLNGLALCRRMESNMTPIIPKEKNVFIFADLCLHPECEYLTPDGWVKVSELKEGQQVLQVDKDTLVSDFVTPIRIVDREYEGNMIEFDTVRGSLRVTEGHTMLHIGQQTSKRLYMQKSRHTFKAGETFPTKGGNWCHFTNYSEESPSMQNELYDEADIWRVCALQADGSIVKNGTNRNYRINVVRDRKIEKLDEIFPEDKYPSTHGTRMFYRKDKDQMQWNLTLGFNHPLLSEKDINIEKLHPSQIKVFLEALEFWDGSPSQRTTLGRISWSSMNEPLVDRIQAYLIKHGYECRKSTAKKINYYTLSIRERGATRVRSEGSCKDKDKQPWYSTPYKGRVYCVTVPKGFILIRDRGQTFVVGNCSAEATVQSSLTLDDNLAYQTFDGAGKPPYYNDSGLLMINDPYIALSSISPIGKQIIEEAYYNRTFEGLSFVEAWLENPNYIKEDKKIKAARNFNKACWLGLSYGLKPVAFSPDDTEHGLQNNARKQGYFISAEQAKGVYNAFWGMYSKIKEYKDKLTTVYKNGVVLTNPLGFRLKPSKPSDVYNALLQSSIASIMSYIEYSLEENSKIPYEFIMRYHDELVLEVREDLADKLIKDIFKVEEEINNLLKFKYPVRLDPKIARNFYEGK